MIYCSGLLKDGIWAKLFAESSIQDWCFMTSNMPKALVSVLFFSLILNGRTAADHLIRCTGLHDTKKDTLNRRVRQYWLANKLQTSNTA